MATQLNWDEFLEKYKPIQNHIDNNASYNGCLFETYGNEYQYIQSIAENYPNRIWTILSDGNVEAVSGWHYVNRLGYMVTELPVEDGEFISIISDDYDDNDDLDN